MPEDGRDTGIIGPVASAAFPICAANRGVCVRGVFVYMSVIVSKYGRGREEKWQRDDSERNQVVTVDSEKYDQNIL